MSSKPLVLHLSHTPLVGAPQKVVQCLNQFTEFRAVALVARDYPPPLKDNFVSNVILWNLKNPLKDELATSLIQEAEIIHIHNTLPKAYLDALRARVGSATIIGQVHSGLREGPLYFNHLENLGLEFAEKLVIGQAHPRFYPDYRIVPNLVLEQSSVSPLEVDETPRVLFAPPHRRSGRWNGKSSEQLNTALSGLSSLELASVVSPTTFVPSNELFEIRRRCHVSIDEIVTGGFHQVSMEGLAAGNVVINQADVFAKEAFRSAIRADELPPFVRMNPDNCRENLIGLLTDQERVRDIQVASQRYFEKYMKPERLIKRFVEVYHDVA